MIIKELFPSTDVVVMLSAGHGGIINNKYTTSPGKMKTFKSFFPWGDDFIFYEGVFNRQVCMQIANYLFDSKISFIFINPGPRDIGPTARARMCDKEHANTSIPYAFAVEIHANAASCGDVTGYEIYTSPKVTKSDHIAKEIYNSVETVKDYRMRSGYSPENPFPDKEAKYSFLMRTQMPAVISEVNFFTNKKRAVQMMQPMHQDKIAYAHYKGITKAIKKGVYK